jgi:Domain of unknown function (DUF4232)
MPTLLVGVILAVAGCGSSGRSSAPPTSAAPSTTAGPSVPSTATTATTGPPTTSTPRVTSCGVSDLRISVTAPLGSAGALHYQLVLGNISSSTCTLYGFPGVSFLDGNGHQIGPPAKEGTTVPRRVVTLAPGSDGYVTLDVTDPGIPPCAGPGTVSRVRVYPPASYAAANVAPAAGMQVCVSPNTPSYTASTVGPVTAAPSPGYNA